MMFDTARLKDALTRNGLGSVSNDELNFYVRAVSEAVDRYCGRNFVRRTYTEWPALEGMPYVVLTERPVYKVISVNYDSYGGFGQVPNTFGASTLLTPGEHYTLEYSDLANPTVSKSGRLFNTDGVWPVQSSRMRGELGLSQRAARGTLKVVYDGGYDFPPEDLVMASINWVVKILTGMRGGGRLQSANLGPAGYTLAQGLQSGPAAFTEIDNVFQSYMDWQWGMS